MGSARAGVGKSERAPPPQEHIFFDLKRYPKCILKNISKNIEKYRKKQRFWAPQALPKPFQNTFQIEVPNDIRFLKAFLIELFKIQSLETLKISIFPKGNHYFSGFCKNRVFGFWTRCGFKKPSKNCSKTKAGRLKNRCQKRVVF